MIHIAIVEDEQDCLLQIRQYLEQYARESGNRFQITCFTDGDGITGFYQSDYDIILMDIQMPFVDGLSAAKMIRAQDPEVVIIFITNMAQYAIQGYSVEAMDYVLKPVSYFSFSQYIGRAVERLKRRSVQYISIKLKDGMQKLAVSDIYYIESRNHSLAYYTKSGDYFSSGKISDAETNMNAYHFFRCNKGCLVNLEHVDGVRENCAVVHGTRIPISRSRKNAFLSILTLYINDTKK